MHNNTDMAFFSAEYLEFFEELAMNNSKDWFDQHRDRYIDFVREPFKDFAQAVNSKLGEFDPAISPSPYIYRINNDLRFQPDKEPYKLHKSASFSPVSDAIASSGYYIQLSAREIYMGGGMYDVSTKLKQDIRQFIADNVNVFRQLRNEPSFVKHFGEIMGGKNKRLPKELREIAKTEPLLYNKQWYFTTTLPVEMMLSDSFLDELMNYYKVILPLNKFFREVILEA